IVLLVGLLAIRTFLGTAGPLGRIVGTATIRDGVRYLPLPHPSGVSRWLNEPANVEAVNRAMTILRGWNDPLPLRRGGPGRGSGPRASAPAPEPGTPPTSSSS